MPYVGSEEGAAGHDTPPVDPHHQQEVQQVSAGSREQQAAQRRAVITAAAPNMILRSKIMMACKLLCFLLAVVIVVHSRGPLTRKVSSPQPFFPRHSLVSDFYTGDVAKLTERLLGADLSLVVYYAPWDRDSQHLRWEMEKAARYHHEQIYFAAVNCWHPNSECKTRYKIRTYPAIVLHVRSVSGTETKALAYGGPRDAGHIIRFLSRALHPLTHVASHADLARLQMEHNAVVLGYYDFSTVKQLPRGFISYYLASLRSLQHHKTSAIAWGVVTNHKVATALSFNETRSVHLVLWNTTLVFTNAASSNSEGMSNWVNKWVDETTIWVDIPGTKSMALHSVLQKGPTLILFTPDNPYHTVNDPFTVLREISLDYSNCNQSSRVSNLARYLSSLRAKSRIQLRQAERVCRSYLQNQLHILHLSKQQFNSKDETCCGSEPSSEAGTTTGDQQSKVCDVCTHPTRTLTTPEELCTNPISWEEDSGLLHHVNKLMTVFSDSCRHLMLQYSPWEHYSVCCQRNNTLAKAKSSYIPHTPEKKEAFDVGSGHPDDRIEKLVALAAEDQCKRLFHGSLVAPHSFVKDQHPAPDITGLGCKTNKTLTFVAVDSLRHGDVAEKLGVNLTTREPQKTAAVIVDVAREAHFIMDASLSKLTLANFIINYTHGLLDRILVTGHVDTNRCKPSQICIQELTSENYLKFTQEMGKMVVVLHYSSNCAACTTVGHVFMTVAHMARHIPNITFARINILTNTLPWNLYFQTLPSIIVHPHYRKSDSSVFDSTLPLTPANLMSFLVSNLDPSHRLSLALSTCRDDCHEQVVQAAAVATTQLHHLMTVTTTKLQDVLHRLVKLKETPHEIPHWENHYQILVHTKHLLVRDIKTQRVKLNHLNQVQKLVPSNSNKLLIESDLLKSLQYIIQSKSNSKKTLESSTLHNEL
nr:thioredoxin domain-containing protein 11-like isoform X3 [Cherax quadricarinatus]